MGGADQGAVEVELANCAERRAVLAAISCLVLVANGPGNHRVVTCNLTAVYAKAVAPEICSIKPSAHSLCRSRYGAFCTVRGDERGVGGK